MPSDSLQLANFFSIMKLSRGRWKGPDTYPLTQGILRIFCQLLNQLFIFINAQTHSEKSWHSYLRHSDRQSPLFFILYSFSFYSYILFYQYLQRDQVTGLGSRMSNRFASCWGGGGGEDGATLFCDNTESKNNREKWTTGNENKKCCLCVPTYKELHSK